jgi:hypothetical protein
MAFNGGPNDLFTLELSADIYRMSKAAKVKKSEGQTFENDGFLRPLRAPDVAKSPRIPSRFNIYPALPMSEDKDLEPGTVLVERMPLEFPEQIANFNWVASEIIFIFSRKVLIEVRVLFESETPFVCQFVTAKVPKDFLQI